jgi:hypothetical protein
VDEGGRKRNKDEEERILSGRGREMSNKSNRKGWTYLLRVEIGK